MAYVGRASRSDFFSSIGRLRKSVRAAGAPLQWRHNVWIAEIIGFYVLIFVLDLALLAPTSSLFFYQPHPFWIPVILIALQYGFAPGVFTALSAIALNWLISDPVQALDEPHFAFVVRTWATPTLWLLAAFVIGQIRQLQIDDKARLKDEVEKQRKQSEVLTNYVSELKQSNANLQLQITTGKTSPLEHAIIQLSNRRSSDERDFMERLKTSLELLIGPNKSSVFIVNDTDSMRVAFKFGWNTNDPYQVSFNKDHPLYQSVIEQAESVSLSDAWGGEIFRGEGKVAFPIQFIHGGGAYGMLKIEEADNSIWSTNKTKALMILAREVGIFLEQTLAEGIDDERKANQAAPDVQETDRSAAP